jgi:hypothetical protein
MHGRKIMSKWVIKLVFWCVAIIFVYLALWNLRPKVRTNEAIVGRFGGEAKLDVSFVSPDAEQVDFYLLVSASQASSVPPFVVKWSILSTNQEQPLFVWTNHVEHLKGGENRINLTGPGNIAAVRAVTPRRQMLRVIVSFQGTNAITPLELGVKWMEVVKE